MTDDVVIEELAPAFRVIFRPLLHSGVEGNVLPSYVIEGSFSRAADLSPCQIFRLILSVFVPFSGLISLFSWQPIFISIFCAWEIFSLGSSRDELMFIEFITF